MCPQTDIDTLLAQCLSEDADERVAAIDELGRRGGAYAARIGPVIESLLGDPDWSVRNNAAEVIGALRYTPARVTLERVLRDDDDATPRASAAEALGELGDPRSGLALVAALFDEDGPVRAYAAASLGLIGGADALPAVRRRVAVEDWPGARIALVCAAMRLGDEGAFDALLALTDGLDEESEIRWYNEVDELLRRNTPAVVIERAAEFDQRLAARSAPTLRERLAALVAQAG
ncbi:HEAT repeat domain-containing protein [Haliangium sp.]|uniref:HEAT repeat domain-containing protein n=1 Tax=Haliangium sp. TaxID=2663208 RepID=UPI003D0BC215